jgi:hypothetical protein
MCAAPTSTTTPFTGKVWEKNVFTRTLQFLILLLSRVGSACCCVYSQAAHWVDTSPGRSSRTNQKWRGPDENIRANLRQYGKEMTYVDVMVSDASKRIWRTGLHFDAIITDRTYLSRVTIVGMPRFTITSNICNFRFCLFTKCYGKIRTNVLQGYVEFTV